MENLLNEEYELVKIGIRQVDELKGISAGTYQDTFASKNTIENMQAYVDTSFSKSRLLKELSEPNSNFYFLKLGKVTVGYLKLNFNVAQTELKSSNGMEIEWIYIEKKYQGKRLGQLLMEKAIQIAKGLKLEYVWLGVWVFGCLGKEY